jgi:hypothetical protein
MKTHHYVCHTFYLFSTPDTLGKTSGGSAPFPITLISQSAFVSGNYHFTVNWFSWEKPLL